MNEFRTAFFIPGGNEKMLAKAGSIAADLIIFDLEDSVLPSEKRQARKLVQSILKDNSNGKQTLAVRVNAMDTPHLKDDLDAVMSGRPDIIMLPKLESGEQLIQLSALLDQLESENSIKAGNTKVIGITAETPRGIFGFDSINNTSNRLVGLSWGPEDLATELGATANRDPQGNFLPPFELVRTLCLAKAKELGVQALDTVFTEVDNPEGLEAECASARRIGYTGKLAIHPSQVDLINQAFSPTQDEMDNAKLIIELFAANPGKGALQLDGKMVDIPHLKSAKRLLKRINH
jgi:citrate lyase subunit beta/citryl-CoA lyase